MTNGTINQSTHDNYHVFDFKNKFYIFDNESFMAYEIEEELYSSIKGKDPQFIAGILSGAALERRSRNNASIQPPTVPEPLSNISINIAQMCNLSCVYCYAGDGEYGMKGKMSFEMAKKCVDFLIRESRHLKKISITFFGGEPLMNIPVLKETTLYSLEAAKKAQKTVTFSITTNGTLLNHEINKFLNDHNFSVTISFDGDKKLQDKNRPFVSGAGSFDVILPLVKEFLQSRGGKATARATVTEKDTDIIALKSILKSYGFKRAQAIVATVTDTAKKSRGLEAIDLNDEVMSNIYSDLSRQASTILKAIQSEKPFEQDLKISKIFLTLQQLYRKNKKVNYCGVGRKMAAIAVNGDIYPCQRFVGDEAFNMGNISDFESSKRLLYTQRFVHKHSICSKCWIKFFCGGGGCLQDNYIMMGGVENVNPRYCAEMEYAIKQTIRLLSDLTEKDINYLFNNKHYDNS